jgi:hypothetical protein
VELEQLDGKLVVTGIRIGGGALAYRLGWRTLGRWLEGSTGATPVPLARVAEIGDHVAVSLDAQELPTHRGERWVQDHVIRHLPGSHHAAE